MRKVVVLALVALTTAALAQTDHDNVDRGRPLRFEDAEPVAFRSMAYEFGIEANFMRRGSTFFTMPLDFVYGIGLNQQLEVGIGTAFGNRPGDDDGFAVTEAEISLLHAFRREIRNSPAFAIKGEVAFPLEGEDQDPHFQFRAIWTKTARQYDRFHLNLDAFFSPGAEGDEREFRLGAILGYTRPIGYFRHFDTTALAEIGFEQGELDGDTTSVFAGLGIRRQINPRSVLDLGLQFDLARERDRVTRLVAGYSTSF